MNNPFFIISLVCLLMISINIFLVIRIRKIKDISSKNIEKERQINQDAILKITNDAENQILEERQIAAKKIADEKQRAADALQKQKETIEVQRSVLSSKSEKELIVDVLIALNGYASRLDRLETSLGYDIIQEKIDSFSDNLKTQLNGVNESIDKKLSKLNVVSKLDSLEYEIRKMKNKFFDDPFGLEVKIDDIHSNCDINISSIESKFDIIEENIASLKSATEDARNSADYAKSAADDAKTAIDDVRYVIESHYN